MCERKKFGSICVRLNEIEVPLGSSLRVLEKCGAETELTRLVMGAGGRFGDVERTHLPNLAMESLGYATYLARTPQADIRNYTLFLQGDPNHHLLHPGILKLSLQALSIGMYDVPFLHLNGMRFLSGGSVCGEELREFLQVTSTTNFRSFDTIRLIKLEVSLNLCVNIICKVARAFPQTEFIDLEVSYANRKKSENRMCEVL